MIRKYKKFKNPEKMREFVETFFNNKAESWIYFIRNGRYIGGKMPYEIAVPELK